MTIPNEENIHEMRLVLDHPMPNMILESVERKSSNY